MCNVKYISIKAVNGLSRSNIESAPFLIYGIDFGSLGFYVGMSSDPIRRFQEHHNSAVKTFNDHGCNDRLKQALISGYKNFYILATAPCKRTAESVEALAIEKYSVDLNVRKETHKKLQWTKPRLDEKSDFISSIIRSFPMGSRKYEQVKDTKIENDDTQRSSFKCEIVWNRQKLRVRCIEGQHKGLFVQCSSKEREKFKQGDIVLVKATLGGKGNQLVSGNNSPIIKA